MSEVIKLIPGLPTGATVQERIEHGREARKRLPRKAFADWSPPADRPSAVDLLTSQEGTRVPMLVPVRHARMAVSPFTFYRGAAIVMASDLGQSPNTDLWAQLCGDAHLSNFGAFGSAERNLVFDVNDFDETLRAPWEWDVKRLAASFVVAGRTFGQSEQCCREAARGCARSYREHLAEFAEMSPLETWYFQVNAEFQIEAAPNAKSRALREQMVAKARARVGERLLPKITNEVEGKFQFVENPPVVTRITSEAERAVIGQAIDEYRASLSDERRFAFDRYELEDFALRVVGVGSVGTRCYLALLVCDDRSPLFLQIKEARRSVLEPYAEPCPFANQGQRVVVGQRMIQAASDIFLGWLRAGDGHDYYVRQMRDMKLSIPLEEFDAGGLARYADLCGWTLARAHAKSGDAATLTGYLGKSDKFDLALEQFAVAYADQTERDFAALARARQAGRIAACDEHL